MRHIQIESWTLNVIERVESGQPCEDFRVELKSEWIEPHKAARRIAGHANAARGETILWLIGVDEDRGVIGADTNELANWFSAVVSEFDGLAPAMTDVVVPVNDKAVVALLFETDRSPFVVKNPAHGRERGEAVSHELPWREGTRTRTAKRADLIKLLTPLLYLPEFEIRSGELYVSHQHEGNKFKWTLKLELYVITGSSMQQLVIPFHNCSASFEIRNCMQAVPFSSVNLKPPYKPVYESLPGPQTLISRRVQVTRSEPDSLTIANTNNEVFIEGPGVLILSAIASTEMSSLPFSNTDAVIEAHIEPIGAERSVPITSCLTWADPDENSLGRWTFGNV